MDLKRNVLPPPTCYMKILVTTETEDSFKEIKSIMSSCIEVLGNQNALVLESYILSRMLYKMNNQWRREKSLQGFERIHACLNRFKELSLLEYVTEMNNHFKECNLYLGEIYLPTQQMIVYLLKQLMAISELMSKTASYCQYSFSYISQNLARGHFIPQNMIFLPMVSRIWTLCKSLCLHCCNWYAKIYKCLKIFPKTQVDIEQNDLPETIQLPSVSNVNKDVTNKMMLASRPLPSTVDDNNLSFTSEITVNEDTVSDQGGYTLSRVELNNIQNKDSPSDHEEDFGCPVNREDLDNVNERIIKKDQNVKNGKSAKNKTKRKIDKSKSFDSPMKSKQSSSQTDLTEMKSEIMKCKSFKKIRTLIKLLEDSYGTSDNLTLYRSRLKQLKKDHLLQKNNEGTSSTFIETARDELCKLLEDCINDKDKERDAYDSMGNRNETVNASEQNNEEEPTVVTFDIKHIMEKPLKRLKQLMLEVHGQLDKTSNEKVKKCALKLKLLKKEYSQENANGKLSKKMLRVAKKNVLKLLN